MTKLPEILMVIGSVSLIICFIMKISSAEEKITRLQGELEVLAYRVDENKFLQNIKSECVSKDRKTYLYRDPSKAAGENKIGKAANGTLLAK